MNHSLHAMIMMTQNKFYQEVIHRARLLDLMPGQPKVLEYLKEHDGCTQKEIGQGCSLNKATINGILNRMELNHLVSITQDSQDKRKTVVWLTDKGKQRSIEVEAIFNDVEARAWDSISSEQQELFLNILETIYKNMAEITKDKQDYE